MNFQNSTLDLDETVDYDNISEKQNLDLEESLNETDENDNSHEIINNICEFNQIKHLDDMLRMEVSAKFCVDHLRYFLLTAVSYKRQEIVNLLLDHGTEKPFGLYKTLLKLISKPSFHRRNWILEEGSDGFSSKLDEKISKLVDAGLNSEHLAQALRHTVQNDEATVALLRNGADINIKGKRGRTALYFFFRGSSCFGDNVDNYVCFRNHLIKLQIAGLPISRGNQLIFDYVKYKYERRSNVGYYLDDLDRSNCLTRKQEYQHECDELKCTKLNRLKTLYDVLFMDSKKLSKFVDHKNFRDIIYAKDFRSKFPKYGSLIKLQFMKGSFRKTICDVALETLPSIVGIALPNLVSSEILYLLDDADVKNIIKAALIVD